MSTKSPAMMMPVVATKLKLCAVAMVANECDIIESFARHTLSFVDQLHILFHNSYDTCRSIVEHLVSEGLPISFEVAATATYSRQRMGDDLVRRIATGGSYDFMLPLDADEFIVASSRAELEAELAGAPAGGTLSLAWLSFVPTERDDAADPNPLTRIRHRLRSPHPHYRKVFFAAALLEREDVYLADGNHKLLSRTGREIPERLTARVALAHYPTRNAEQLTSKVFIGSMARRLSADYTDDQSRHWRSLMTDPSLTTDTPVELLSRIAMRYLDCTHDELIEAPLATSALQLRYAKLIRVNAFERLSAFCVAAFLERDPAGSVDEVTRQGLLEEIEVSRHTMQLLHEKVRAVKRKARIRTISAIGGAILMAAVAAACVLAI